jgi:transketolase
VVYSALGTSHQSTEDLAALRALPHITIFSPCDAAEMTACLELTLGMNGPVYLRMGKADLGTVHATPPSLRPGQLLPLRQGAGPIAWIATGSMVHTALAVAESWRDSPVWSVPCIKPIEEEAVASICRAHPVVVVLEEHSIYGGLGSTIAEISACYAPTRVCRIGILDRFSKYCGSYGYLMKEHQLDRESVLTRVKRFLDRTNGWNPRCSAA